MPSQVITANRLTDGRVVWLTADSVWDEDVNRAAVADDKTSVEAALAKSNPAVSELNVVEPYAVEVEVTGGRIVPKSLRERIRAEGPTIAGAYAGERPAAARNADIRPQIA
ncbi:DUF2849 domain-containing protein [Prosthecomicrobium hirschii]|uniref:DUF2849 domain-containing protein n=1 Tax=Prosthecodimorpha hirschii TaxID=665126 RepID=UPI00221E9A3D|nr:DUF2849 domain-containing protein [Prosthecomicrobium hirschii]